MGVALSRWITPRLAPLANGPIEDWRQARDAALGLLVIATQRLALVRVALAQQHPQHLQSCLALKQAECELRVVALSLHRTHLSVSLQFRTPPPEDIEAGLWETLLAQQPQALALTNA
jgi:hypothetical protein